MVSPSLRQPRIDRRPSAAAPPAARYRHVQKQQRGKRFLAGEFRRDFLRSGTTGLAGVWLIGYMYLQQIADYKERRMTAAEPVKRKAPNVRFHGRIDLKLHDGPGGHAAWFWRPAAGRAAPPTAPSISTTMGFELSEVERGAGTVFTGYPVRSQGAQSAGHGAWRVCADAARQLHGMRGAYGACLRASAIRRSRPRAISSARIMPDSGPVRAEGRVVAQGRTIITCEGKITDERGAASWRTAHRR